MPFANLGAALAETQSWRRNTHRSLFPRPNSPKSAPRYGDRPTIPLDTTPFALHTRRFTCEIVTN